MSGVAAPLSLSFRQTGEVFKPGRPRGAVGGKRLTAGFGERKESLFRFDAIEGSNAFHL